MYLYKTRCSRDGNLDDAIIFILQHRLLIRIRFRDSLFLNTITLTGFLTYFIF